MAMAKETREAGCVVAGAQASVATTEAQLGEERGARSAARGLGK